MARRHGGTPGARTGLDRVEAYRRMLLIRRFEERTIELYQQNLIGGSLHTYIGQEAVAVGVCLALRADDYITMTYRSRGHMLAKGADPKRTMAEILGRVTGYCHGKGGPMHLTDVEHGILGANAIVAAGIPIAVGAALSCKMQGIDRLAVAFFGDGATNQGVFHEALNLAAVWDLPVLFVCENNLYSEMTPIAMSTKVDVLVERAKAHGIEGWRGDGMDVEEVYEQARQAVAEIRAGSGPRFLEFLTYRYEGHMLGDAQPYRSREEVEYWKTRDPLTLLEGRIAAEGGADALAAVERQVTDLVAEATEFGLSSPEPDEDGLYEDIWSDAEVADWNASSRTPRR